MHHVHLLLLLQQCVCDLWIRWLEINSKDETAWCRELSVKAENRRATPPPLKLQSSAVSVSPLLLHLVRHLNNDSC